MNGHSAARLALLAAVLSLAPRAEATVVIGQELAEIARQADAIFVGRVIAVESRWKDEARGSIETLVTLTVLDPLYGEAKPEVTLRFAGGQVGVLSQVIAGMPQFHPGEEVVLFTTAEPLVSPIVGFHQGCFRIVARDGERVVLDAEGAPITGTTARSLSVGRRQDGSASAISLDRFLDTVRRHVAARQESGR